MPYPKIREEELKNKVGADWFGDFDTTEILGNIDFTVFPQQESLFAKVPLLWAEAKTGNFDIATMFIQLILTIGKARTFDKTLPPAFLGAFDFHKIAFVPYISIQDIFYQNDFNWNVTPSNHETKEFKLIKDRIEAILKQNTYVYDYDKDAKELRFFIANNIAKATETSKIKIDKNNFIPIYLRWLETIKPIIDVNWDELKKANIVDSDFYLADLFVDDKDTHNIDDDLTIRDSLFVVFQNQGYKISKENLNQMFDATINIKNKAIYQQFWKRYKRPPIKEFQDYIIERRDLLVPQDIRERKGAFFTPRIWVELSQKYLTDVLGEDWQDECYIWDCAAGTGNLLAGLTNKYNIWASTLDQADVSVMHERIDHGANLLKDHVFQFDFLNDDFSKLPKGLQDIINDPEKRKKLVMYINPPYAEASSYGEDSIAQVATQTQIFNLFKEEVGAESMNELFAQFFIRIYKQISDCKLASFSTLKYITSEKFTRFQNCFQTKYNKGFVVPADTFDNVKGEFPIGFTIWDSSNKEIIQTIKLDIFNARGIFQGEKSFSVLNNKSIGDWRKTFYFSQDRPEGSMIIVGPSMQSNNNTFITNNPAQSYKKKGMVANIIKNNITEMSIYFAVRHCIEATWLNDRDQFLYPNDGWQDDTEFQNNCLAYTLFHGQNRITSKEGINHWIPFTEKEVDARDKFKSSFMTDFIRGRLKTEVVKDESQQLRVEVESTTKAIEVRKTPLVFSAEAQAVFEAGRELWRYYHAQPNCDVNASLYDIREHFQGRSSSGRMNNKSTDEKYMELIGNLRDAIKTLAKKIEPKVYEYGFLRE